MKFLGSWSCPACGIRQRWRSLFRSRRRRWPCPGCGQTLQMHQIRWLIFFPLLYLAANSPVTMTRLLDLGPPNWRTGLAIGLFCSLWGGSVLIGGFFCFVGIEAVLIPRSSTLRDPARISSRPNSSGFLRWEPSLRVARIFTAVAFVSVILLLVLALIALSPHPPMHPR